MQATLFLSNIIIITCILAKLIFAIFWLNRNRVFILN